MNLEMRYSLWSDDFVDEATYQMIYLEEDRRDLGHMCASREFVRDPSTKATRLLVADAEFGALLTGAQPGELD